MGRTLGGAKGGCGRPRREWRSSEGTMSDAP